MSARDENCQSDEHRASLTRLPSWPSQQSSSIWPKNWNNFIMQELGINQWSQFEDSGQIRGLPNCIGFNEAGNPNGATPG